MEVRRARAEDVGAIRAIVERAYTPYIDLIGRRPAPMEDDHAGQVDRGEVFVADDGSIVGLVVLLEAPDHLLIENVAVEPRRQREGIGSTLLAFAESTAFERTLAELRLYTNEAMTENIARYRRMGFREEGRRGEDGYRRVFFTKRVRPASPGRDDIVAAANRVAPHTRRTPVLEVGAGTFGVETPLALKLELLQVTGSFKPRGAFNRMLTANVGSAGVVAASGGNFGLAVGHAANELGHHAEIFVPSSSPTTKIDRVRASGADVTVIEGLYDDASEAAAARRAETDAVWMHPFDQPAVVAGQGTVGLELSEQMSAIDTVVVSVGGGGLIAGIASWFGDDVRVVAVEPETSRCMGAAMDAGEPVDVTVESIAADSLGAKRVGEIAFGVAAEHVDRFVTVSDQDIRVAQRAIWNELHQLAEPGGATALAALMQGAYRPAREHVVVVICGSNGDSSPVIGEAHRP